MSIEADVNPRHNNLFSRNMQVPMESGFTAKRKNDRMRGKDNYYFWKVIFGNAL